MKKTLRIFTALLTALLSLAASAQGSGQDLMISPQTNEIIPPSPSSAQQMRYQSPQPSLATGAVNLTIPLYTIEVEGVSIPFTLKYQTSGIKPFDDPYPCGYGWALQPALKVTRTIRGRADERYEYWGDRAGDLLNYPEKAFAAMCRLNPGAISGENIQDRYDTEKDIFTISLPSGTYTRIAVKSPFERNKWDFIGGGDDDEIIISSASLSTITAVDAAGITYTFGTPCETIYPHTDINVGETTAWTLQSITLPSGREISFEWASFHHDGIFFYGGCVGFHKYDPVDAYSLFQKEWSDVYPNSGFLNESYYRDRLHLSSVTFPGGRIDLGYTDKMWSTFKVSDTKGGIIKEASMTYGSGDSEKHFLYSVDISDTGTYTFSYDPERFDGQTNKQDWWGYFNGKSQGLHPLDLTPALAIEKIQNHMQSYGDYNYIGNADRTPDATAMQAGILKKVTYPTGGSSEFEYEPHRFPATRVDAGGKISPDTDPYLDMGGGLRVRSIKTYTGSADTQPHIREYSYDSVVVNAVPSAATFVSTSKGIGLYEQRTLTPRLYFFEMINVSHASNYMDNRIGEDHIWYPHVTETFPEGKIEYFHGRTLPCDTEYREWGHTHPVRMENIFSKGARLTKRVTYKNENGIYSPVVTEEYYYEKVSGGFKSASGVKTGYFENTRIERKLVQTAVETLEAPDFSNGRYLSYATYIPEGFFLEYSPHQIKIDMPVTYESQFDEYQTPYRVDSYTMLFQSDRLRSKTVTQHLENGDFSQTDTYEYVPGTSIVSSVVTTNPADDRVERVDLTYASPSRSEAERLMRQANMVGIPVQSKYTFGSATTTVRNEMSHYGNRVFRPSKTWLSRGSDEWLARSCDFDAFGNIREYRGEDSIPTSYFWGYSAMHPVYRVDGASFSEIRSLNPGADILGGNAERADIISLLGDRHVTRALWRPLVGMSSLRQPSGFTETYSYDSAGRLVRTAIEGHGPVAGYTYHINDGGLNYTTAGVYTSAAATAAAVRETVNYDGLGREISKVTRAPNPNYAGDISFLSVAAIDKDITAVRDSFYATMTVYDRMDRPYRQWAPVKVASRHPTLSDIRSAANAQYGTAYAYASTYYEPSPRQLATGSMKAGRQWHDASKRVTVRRLVNTADGDYLCHKYVIYNDTRLKRTGKWQPGTLLVEETTDEEGHVAMVFTDRTGKTVMQREGVPGDWNDTRFLYNDYGDLLSVMQPDSPFHGAPLNSCFVYEYDNRGNCISKTLPGSVTTRYWFDRHNRLVAEQDGNMADAGRCMLYCYDPLGRLAFRAIADAGDSDLDALRTTAFTVTAPLSAVSPASKSGGYSLPDGVPLQLHALVEARYYDSYAFTSGLHGDWDSYTVPPGYPSPDRSVKGLQTGVLAGDRLTVSHFDKAGRVIRTATGPLSEAPEHTAHTAYDYEGKPVTELGVTRYGGSVVEQRKRHTYHSSAHPRKTTVWQGGDTAVIDRSYDHAGRLCEMMLSDRIRRTMSYDVNSWLASSSATIEKTGGIGPIIPLQPLSAAPQASITLPGQTYTSILFSENLYYADSREGCTPRYDGKISGRSSDNRTTAYSYDSHGRLASSVTVKPQVSLPAFRDDADFSTAYTYDRNANIKSVTRQGVTDIVDDKHVYGLHDEIWMTYSRNRLSSVTVDSEGADYEGRTGLQATDGSVSGFAYDANGNMTVDPVRGINRIVYNHLNQPVEITFAAGHRQTVSYDGLGQKIRIDYAEGPETVLGEGFPVEQAYQVRSSRYYAGPHIFCNGELEYSAFEGGYFDPEGGTMYYLTDWQGNNAAVVNSKGDIVQKTTYYPYGEPTVEPTGQRFLFGGKEREHAAGRNTYDFSARCLTPYGNWNVIDPKSETFYPFSPYSYCGGDPINFIDPDGKFSFRIFASAAKYMRKVYKIYKKTGTLTVKNLKQAGIDEVTDAIGDLYTVFDSDATALDKIEAGVDLIVGTDLNNKGDKAAKKILGLADDSALANKSSKKFNDLTKEASFEKKTKSKTIIYRKNGGISAAEADFNSMNLTEIKEFNTDKYGPAKRGLNENGETIILRYGSSDGSPTIERQVNGRTKNKIRYDE